MKGACSVWGSRHDHYLLINVYTNQNGLRIESLSKIITLLFATKITQLYCNCHHLPMVCNALSQNL